MVGGIERNKTQIWWRVTICNRNAAKWKERHAILRSAEAVMEGECFALDLQQFSRPSQHGTAAQVAQHYRRHSRV